MSHIVQIKTKVRDRTAVHSACHRLRLPAPVEGPAKLFTSTVTGLAVSLPEWRYPLVCELATGQLFYDNFNGHWGDHSISIGFSKPTPSKEPRWNPGVRGTP